MLQIVGEAGAEQFGLNFHQASHVKLPEPQLAFDPRVAKLHDSCSTAVLRLSFLAGHLFPERKDCCGFLQASYRTTTLLILRTALWFANATLTLFPVRLIAIGNHSWLNP